MPASLAVNVLVAFVLQMPCGFALVEVPVVFTMEVSVVHVVDVVAVWDRHVPTTFTVDVAVIGVFRVATHRGTPPRAASDVFVQCRTGGQGAEDVPGTRSRSARVPNSSCLHG